MVFAVQGRNGDSIERYDGSGGAAFFSPRGEDTLGAGGAGGVEDGYFSPRRVGGTNLPEIPRNSSAGIFHWLFSKSPRVSSGSQAMMGCGAPAGGIGIPTSAPSDVEVVQTKDGVPAETPPPVQEKTPCEIVLNALDAGAFGVLQVVTAYQETGYFLMGVEILSKENFYFRLVPASKDFGNFPFKEGQKIGWVYPEKQYPRGGTVCENPALSPETNSLVSRKAHEFLLVEADKFEKSRGHLRAVREWEPRLDWIVALFADARLAAELSQSIVIRTPNVSKDNIEYLRTVFNKVGIEEIKSGSSSYAVYSHIQDQEDGKSPRFFVIRDQCYSGGECSSLVHNYNEDLDFYYVGRNSKGPDTYRLTLPKEKVIEGHRFPEGTLLEFEKGKLQRAELFTKARIQGNRFQKSTKLYFIKGKLDQAEISYDHTIRGVKFKAGEKVYFKENGELLLVGPTDYWEQGT